MVNIFKSTIFNHLVAGATTIIFSTTVISSPKLHAVEANADLNVINFVIRNMDNNFYQNISNAFFDSLKAFG